MVVISGFAMRNLFNLVIPWVSIMSWRVENSEGSLGMLVYLGLSRMEKCVYPTVNIYFVLPCGLQILSNYTTQCKKATRGLWMRIIIPEGRK